MTNKFLLLTIMLCALVLCSCQNKDKQGSKEGKDTKTEENTETPEQEAERKATEKREEENFKAVQKKGGGTPLGSAGITCTREVLTGKISCPPSSSTTPVTTTPTTPTPSTP